MSKNFYGTDENYAGRVPVQPLPYELKELADTRELIVNYKNGDMYVVSDDGTLIDITSHLSELIQNANSSNTLITIEGLGEVKLSRILELLWENRITFNSKEQTGIYLPKGKQADFKSISIKDNLIQISDFDTADNGTIPVKIGDKIYWMKASSETPNLSAVQGDGDTIIYKDGILTLRGFAEANNNQVPVKINGVLKFVTINTDGSLGMTEEEKEALYENFKDVQDLKGAINKINDTIENIRIAQDTNNLNMENIINEFSKMVIDLSNAIADIIRIDLELSKIDYEYLTDSLEAINNDLNSFAITVETNKNNITEINNQINHLSEIIKQIQNAINSHIKDDKIHSSIHYMSQRIDPSERVKNHLYIQMGDEYTNDIPDTYNAKLRNIYSNLGAEVAFKIGENSDYNLNDDLAIEQ